MNAAILARSVAAAVLLTTILNACGGGSGSGPPPPNRSPTLVRSAADQRLVTGHTFRYDASLGGTAVSDPDGDRLIYSVRVSWGSWGYALPPGLSLSGTVISGVPSETGWTEIDVQVDDGRGGDTAEYRFLLRVVANSAPVVANPNVPRLTANGAFVYLDAAQNGTTFTEPDGDAMDYAVTLRGDPHGLAISGTHVSGTFDAVVGAVEVVISASDPYGAVTSDSFLVAAPAPEPSATPNLPATSYTYRDEDLPLPLVFRESSESFNPLADGQPADNRTTNEGATLGRVLFYDKRLSITNTHACASCHEQSRGFASGLRFNTGVLGIPLKRNAMALGNARYNAHLAWFSDMRATGDLRNLIFMPIDNHDELGMALFSVESKLKNVSFYPALFTDAFGTPDITRERIAAALAQFVQSLISYQSKSDLAINSMTNDPAIPEAVFTAQEMQGFKIYTGSGHCAICHERRANTNVLPANNGLDAIPTDPGTQVLALSQGLIGVFRAASLRNIAMSGPYMHDGRFSTLREVIDHYDHGVQDSPNVNPILGDLNLTEEDKDALEAFLNTLTDNIFLSDPKFSDPFAP